MDPPDPAELAAACPAAGEAEWLAHAAGFVAAFVAPAKRERWLDLLARRPRRMGRDGHKMHAALDRRACRCVGESPPGGLRGDGVFYGFSRPPQVMPAGLAAAAAGGGDAIFSLVPGALALYFFHEGEVWLCARAPGEPGP